MYFFPIVRFAGRMIRSIQRDLAFCAKHLPLLWMGVIALNFFLMTFDVIKNGAAKFQMPLIIFIVGLTVTNIPFYILLPIAYFSPKALVPVYILYFIGFVWMFHI